MRSAAPVGLTSAGGGGWRVVQTLLAAAAVAAVAQWTAAMAGSAPAQQAALAAGAAVLASLVAWRAARPRAVHLAWDGTAWSADGVTGSVVLALDLGGWVLLRFVPGDGRGVRWLPLLRADAPAAWHGLRAALHARAAPEQQP